MSARAIWIDTDAAIGVPEADVDDGLALVQAFHSPEVAVRGVSAVFGNAPLAQTFPIARELTARFGPRSCPVYEGAPEAALLGEETHAVRALAAALEAGPLTVVALGPLTNVASLAQLRPDLRPRIEAVVMVAARRPGQRFLSLPGQRVPFPDLNFDCDPPAVQALLDIAVPLVFAPWEVSSHVWIEAEDLDRLAASGPGGAWLAAHCGPWLDVWRRDLGATGFNPFDSLAVAAVTHPELLRGFEAGIWIETGPDDRASPEQQAAGATKPHLLADAARAGRRGLYTFEPLPALKGLLLDRLARRAPG